MKTTFADSWLDIARPCDIDLWVMKWRSVWPTWTSNFEIMSQYDPTFDVKINAGHCDLYFIVQWFCVISWRLFDVRTSYTGILSQYDQTFDGKTNVDHCDLYFMVQWYCVITWTLFDVWTSYIRIMSQFYLTFDLKINIGHYRSLRPILSVKWFCLIVWPITAKQYSH